MLLLLLSCISCASTKNTTTNANILNGTWIPVKEEISGKELPAAAFEKQILFITDSNYRFSAESVDKGVIRYGAGKIGRAHV